MRFTLPKLFLAITMAALACAGMTMRNRFWADCIVSATILLFVVAAIAGFQSLRRSRAFRLAFALVGGGYLVVVMSGGFLAAFRDSMLTSRILVLAAQRLQLPTEPSLVISPASSGLPLGAQSYLPASYNELETFLNSGSSTNRCEIPAVAFYEIGQCVWSWLLALSAGCFSGWLYSRRETVQTS